MFTGSCYVLHHKTENHLHLYLTPSHMSIVAVTSQLSYITSPGLHSYPPNVTLDCVLITHHPKCGGTVVNTQLEFIHFPVCHLTASSNGCLYKCLIKFNLVKCLCLVKTKWKRVNRKKRTSTSTGQCLFFIISTSWKSIF